ncbi:hypothetical protein O181_062448 [Austropuccinia psidii MF-1]|uniref:Expansin-like EG45 domain-containing protein n=1 Tax=Austropuccinia psidii MF-1 TaxID=1389203 RepID=A0A9Q3EPR5_9BASI|nr:hypothetical protein [Austropuccinia psidii MF-1]
MKLLAVTLCVISLLSKISSARPYHNQLGSHRHALSSSQILSKRFLEISRTTSPKFTRSTIYHGRPRSLTLLKRDEEDDDSDPSDDETEDDNSSGGSDESHQKDCGSEKKQPHSKAASKPLKFVPRPQTYQSLAQANKYFKTTLTPKPSSSSNFVTSSSLSHKNYKIDKAQAHEEKKTYGTSHSEFKHSQSPSFSQFGGNVYQGKATFFSQGGVAGACGNKHKDSDYVVAIQSNMYSQGELCGKNISITRPSTGRTIFCLAADECPGCPSSTSLDLSVAAFKALGDPDEGIFDISWKVLN